MGLSARVYYGNSVADWVTAGIVAAAVWSGLWIVRRFMAARGRRYAAAHRLTLFHLTH